MKRFLPYILCALSFCYLHAQNEQFVSTMPMNKNVILEEYTGVNCVNCPDGHLIANHIAETHPGRAFVINIHAGSFAANTYTTDEGTGLLNAFGVNAFPKATINRHTFNNYMDNYLLVRGDWTSASDTIFSQPSPVNIAARGTLDWTTRELNVTVQLYYTSDETSSTNLLNVAILQNNVIGEQDGYYYNPQQVVGNHYRHMHMLRHLVTGQWGDSINITTAGTFIERTYNFTIPEMLGSPNPIEAKLEDLAFVAFVAQGQQEILTVCEVEIENIHLPAIGARLKEIEASPVLDCSNHAAIAATVKNIGSDPVTALSFEYRIADNETLNLQWTGNILSLETETILLPGLSVTPNTNQTATARITNINGQDFDGETFNTTFKKMVADGTSTMTLQIKTDGHSQELSFKLYNAENEIIQQSTPDQFTNNIVCEFPINLPEEGCYHLEVNDAGGNGITSGYIRLYNADNQVILNATGNNFFSTFHGMITYGTVGVSENTTYDTPFIFPNPASEVIHIQTSDDIQTIEIYSMEGQCVFVENGNVHNISVNNLAKGMYILKVTTEQGVNTYKISKQ